MANKPERSFKLGGVEVAVWERKQETEKGVQIRRGVSAQRRYYDKKANEWKSTTIFGEKEIGTLIALLQKALNYIIDAPKVVSPEETPKPVKEEEIPF